MNKPIAIIGIALVLIFIALSAPRSIKTSNFTLGSVNGGNTLVLHNGYEIVLLGISGSDKSQDYLKGFVGKDIRIIMDSSSPRLGKTKKGEKMKLSIVVPCFDEEENAAAVALGTAFGVGYTEGRHDLCAVSEDLLISS